MELVTIVTVQEAFLVPNVWDKVAGAMVCSILNVGYAMELVLCNVGLVTGQENESSRDIL